MSITYGPNENKLVHFENTAREHSCIGCKFFLPSKIHLLCIGCKLLAYNIYKIDCRLFCQNNVLKLYSHSKQSSERARLARIFSHFLYFQVKQKKTRLGLIQPHPQMLDLGKYFCERPKNSQFRFLSKRLQIKKRLLI